MNNRGNHPLPSNNPTSDQSASVRLKEARRSGKPAAIADALAAHASKLVQEGKIGFARNEIDEAIDINQQLGKIYDQARLTQFSATLCRLEGNLPEAKRRAILSANLAEQIHNSLAANPIIVGSATELGEIALTEGDGDSAAYAFGQAYELGIKSGLLETLQSSLLRKKAAALALAGKQSNAAIELESAYNLLIKNGDTVNAIRTRIEQISALIQSTSIPTEFNLEKLITETRQNAESSGDHATLADINILLATQALQQNNPLSALAAAKLARNEALAGRAPIQYISSSAVISQLEESNGNRIAAYGTLAAGWATLGDLLGPQVARATYEPLLQQMRERWGNAAFWEVKASYDDMRRSMLASEAETSDKRNDPKPSGGAQIS